MRDDLDSNRDRDNDDSGDSENGEHGERSEREHRVHTDLLRIVADDFDQAQRVRVAKGEQIRAIAQGRDQQQGGAYLAGLGFAPVTRDGKEVTTAADLLLKAILRGATTEPHPYLAMAYLAAYRSERNSYGVMDEALADHPAWPWMKTIRGVGPTLGAKLLSRLDLDRADNPSSFWCYAGLGTVPGQRWLCPTCGYVGIHPSTHEITGKHKGCKTLAAKVAGPEDGVRAAQPRGEKGQKRSYDAYVKKTMFLLASSWLKAGPKSFYNQVYRRKVAFYERERPGWEKGRRHAGALRAAEKLFLSHLYTAWCDATGKVAKPSYVESHLGHDDIVSPQEVLAWEASARSAAAA